MMLSRFLKAVLFQRQRSFALERMMPEHAWEEPRSLKMTSRGRPELWTAHQELQKGTKANVYIKSNSNTDGLCVCIYAVNV